MIAGLLDQVVQACSLPPQNEDAIRLEVEFGVIRGSALIQAEHPDMLLLHLLQRTDEVRDACDANVLRSPGGGLRHRRRYGSGTALGQNDSIDTRAVGGTKESAEIVRVLDAIESKEEAVLLVGFGSEQVFDSEESPLHDNGQHALMCVCAGNPGELVARLQSDPNACGAAELNQPLKALIAALTGDAYVIKLASAGANGLFDRVKTVKNFHT